MARQPKLQFRIRSAVTWLLVAACSPAILSAACGSVCDHYKPDESYTIYDDVGLGPAPRLPTLEAMTSDTYDYTAIVVTGAPSDERGWFRPLSDYTGYAGNYYDNDGWNGKIRRTEYPDVTVIAGTRGRAAADRVYYYEPFTCTSDSAWTCASCGERELGDPPGAGLYVVVSAGVDGTYPVVYDMLDDFSDPLVPYPGGAGIHTYGMKRIGSANADGTFRLDGAALAGGPDFGRAITADELRYVLFKSQFYVGAGYPLWFSAGECDYESRSDFANEGDPGLDEFLTGYEAGAGATAAETQFAPPIERLRRHDQNMRACGYLVDPTAGMFPATDEGPERAVAAEAPPCEDAGHMTDLAGVDALLEWAATPVLSARFTGTYDAGGDSFSVATACDFELAAGASLRGVANFDLSAGDIVIAGVVQARALIRVEGESIRVRSDGALRSDGWVFARATRKITLEGIGDGGAYLGLRAPEIVIAKNPARFLDTGQITSRWVELDAGERLESSGDVRGGPIRARTAAYLLRPGYSWYGGSCYLSGQAEAGSELLAGCVPVPATMFDP